MMTRPQPIGDVEDERLAAWAQASAGMGAEVPAAARMSLLVDEEARLEALARYQILDETPEVLFDDITRLAASICSTPVALLSIVGADRVSYKARIGLSSMDARRQDSFCGSAILRPGL